MIIPSVNCPSLYPALEATAANSALVPQLGVLQKRPVVNLSPKTAAAQVQRRNRQK